MPSLEQVKQFRQERYKSSTALIDKKGADYNRDQQENGDTLFNLKVAEILGIVPSAEEGILVRLSDKFMRLISLTKPGREAAVKGESVLDTIDDIHNYTDYLGLIWQERRAAVSGTEKTEKPEPVEYERDYNNWCSAESSGGDVCSRPKGHTGVHVAHGNDDDGIVEYERWS